MWLFLLLNSFWSAECRIGEAKTPGPAVADSTWSLGVCNPSGLLGKSILLSEVDTDVIAVSETHLTASARSMLMSSLRSHSSYCHVITGAPLCPRSHATDAGQYSGVATVTRVPARAFCANWPPDLFETGRVQITGSLINNTWITGAVMYGYPQSKIHHDPVQRSIDMLDFLIDHMTQVAIGPRYLCGDLNHEAPQLPNLDRLRALGWREVQDLEFQLSGRSPAVTCKGKTRKDMLWISPELVPWFRQVTVDAEQFPDHCVLRAEFNVGPGFARRFLWPQPCEVPWNDVPPLDFPVDFSHDSPTVMYRHLWTSKERQTCPPSPG